MFRNLIGWLRGGATEDHYRKQSEGSADSFYNEDELPFAEDATPFAEPVEEGLTRDIELVEFKGESEDIDWMTFDHNTGEVTIKFLEHGEETKHAHVYVYADMPHDEFVAIRDGEGPFPDDRHPYYQKEVSTGQRVNYYTRNDHHDDLYEYQRLDREGE
jgi:hypothetical protein